MTTVTVRTVGNQERLDGALAMVAAAAEQLLEEAGNDSQALFAARRCLDVQDLLEEAGARPQAHEHKGLTSRRLLEDAAAALDEVEEPRPPRLGPARVELAGAILEVARH